MQSAESKPVQAGGPEPVRAGADAGADRCGAGLGASAGQHPGPSIGAHERAPRLPWRSRTTPRCTRPTRLYLSCYPLVLPPLPGVEQGPTAELDVALGHLQRSVPERVLQGEGLDPALGGAGGEGMPEAVWVDPDARALDAAAASPCRCPSRPAAPHPSGGRPRSAQPRGRRPAPGYRWSGRAPGGGSRGGGWRCRRPPRARSGPPQYRAVRGGPCGPCSAGPGRHAGHRTG